MTAYVRLELAKMVVGYGVVGGGMDARRTQPCAQLDCWTAGHQPLFHALVVEELEGFGYICTE